MRANPSMVQVEAAEPDETALRDYSLEAVDDVASFDLERDLRGWFVALHTIERVWGDPPNRLATLTRYGIRDERHFFQVQATVARFCRSPFARERYGDEGDIAQLKADANDGSAP